MAVGLLVGVEEGAVDVVGADEGTKEGAEEGAMVIEGTDEGTEEGLSEGQTSTNVQVPSSSQVSIVQSLPSAQSASLSHSSWEGM